MLTQNLLWEIIRATAKKIGLEKQVKSAPLGQFLLRRENTILFVTLRPHMPCCKAVRFGNLVLQFACYIR